VSFKQDDTELSEFHKFQ